jgi:hypothetical protein
MGDAMVTIRSGRLGVVVSSREWLTVRAVGKAHVECERALGLFEAGTPEAADYGRMVEVVESLAGVYRCAARRPLGAGGGDGVAVELLWVARLQAFSCMWLAEMAVRFPGDDGGSRVAGALLKRAVRRGEREGRSAWIVLCGEAERWALTFRVAAATCEQWATPPMSCIMDACSKTRVVDAGGALVWELTDRKELCDA